MPDQILVQRPAVLIGLGGTGKQTLQYLRRMFLDRYGVKTLPHIAMVVIDTDGREQNLDGSRYDEFDREVAFGRELIVTPMNECLGNIRHNRAQYPHIDSWLDRSLDSHGDIQDGAGQIRALGRLAFFEHYENIKKAIHDAYDKVTSSDTQDKSLDEHNIRLDPQSPVETWLVFSVAGGTGAGMFLDVAFLAKQEARGFAGSEARSLILLPTAFSSDLPQTLSTNPDHRVFANAYAALTELESYNYPQGVSGDQKVPQKFQLQWTREQYAQRPRATIDGPVFVNSWLVDNASRDGGGQVNGSTMALCQMMAEWMFVQYSAVAPALSGVIRSARSNHSKVITPLAAITLAESKQQDGRGQQQDQEIDQQTLQFSRRYSGFGLSKIYIPTTNLANQAYARLVGDISAFWQVGNKQTDVRGSIQRRLYSKIHLPMSGATQGFTDALGRRLSVDGAKQALARRFENLINDELRKLKTRQFDPGSEDEARDWFSSEVMTKLLDGGAAAMARRGEISRIVQSDNTAAAFAEIRDALNAFLSETLRTPGERIDFAEEALRLIVKDFQQAAQQATDRAKKEQQKGDKLQRECDELMRWASEHRGFDRGTIFEAGFAKMRDRATADFRRQVFLASARVATDAADYIGIGRKVKDPDGRERVVDTGLLSSLLALRSTLKALVIRSQERITALQRQPISPLNGRAPATKVEEASSDISELDEIYVTEDNKPIETDRLAELEEGLYKALGHKGFDSPWYLQNFTDAGGVEGVFGDMLDYTRTQLSYLPGKMQDALDCLSRKFGKDNQSQFQAELRKVIDRGSPWLPRPTHNMGGDNKFKNMPAEYYVAVSDEAALDPKLEMFRIAGVTVDKYNKPQDDGRKVVDGPLDTVYFESEVAGVPLCALHNIDLYRNAYLGYLDSDDPATRVVHTELDIERYTNLVPLTWEEYNLHQEAVRTFILGVAKGAVVEDTTVQNQSGLPEWRFFENSTLSVRPIERKLRRYTTAIRLLARRDRTLCSALQREIAARDANLITADDTGHLFNAIDAMQRDQPVGGSEWKTAIGAVLADMRTQYGASIVQQAQAAEASAAAWRGSVPSGSTYPFLRLKALVQAG